MQALPAMYKHKEHISPLISKEVHEMSGAGRLESKTVGLGLFSTNNK